MNTSDLERAELHGRDQARAGYRAIQQAIAALEARSPGCTRHIAAWSVREAPGGELTAVPAAGPTRGPLTVAEALRRTQARTC